MLSDYHGKLEPPDFERRRRIPTIDLYVSPSIVQIADAEPVQSARVIDLWTTVVGWTGCAAHRRERRCLMN
ncbi:MAG TPA: hypothetical protein VLX31_02115 [Streptosporangiaceae bacterium]|nr:hypothetical protein [Streptosporangiaceae bacterium]